MRLGERATENVSADELAATMQDFWENGAQRRGVCKIEPFRKDLRCEGILYQSKNEFDEKGNEIFYQPVLSPMLEKQIKRDNELALN